MSTVDIDKPYEQSSLEKALAQQRTHIKAELLAKMPEAFTDDTHYTQEEIHTRITKRIEEL